MEFMMILNDNLNAASICENIPETVCSENIAFGKFSWNDKVHYGIIIFIPVDRVRINIGVVQTPQV